MTLRPLYLTDASSARLAALDVSVTDDHFEGTANLDQLPDDVRGLFAEFEDVVEGQVFSLLDSVELRIRSAGLRLDWGNGASSPVEDLQIFPSTGAISFRATPPAGLPLNGQAAAGRPRTPVS